MKDDLYYRIALTMVPALGPVRAKILMDHFTDAQSVFKARKKEISCIEGIGEFSARQLKEWNAFKEVETELRFIEKHHIRCLFLTDPDYPKRLLHCYDPPTLLYYRGNADLNQPRVASIIGTRNHTDYGKQVTEQLIASLSKHGVTIVSGLAYGIDGVAHKAALHSSLPTIGVLAHGLDMLYPAQHTSLAKEMIVHGGLLTEFRKNNKPDRHNFPKRNRIVAGISDATIVIETAARGGSMITAELAYNYNRDVFAVPGRITDNKSSGCLTLISQNKSLLFTSGDQFAEIMGWQEKKKHVVRQKELFPELREDEKLIVNLLTKKTSMPIDEIYLQSGLSSSSVAAAILNLELQNVISSLPGKMYALQ